MASVTIRPNETLSATTGARTPASTATHTLVGDASDASHLRLWPEAGIARVGIPAPPKPAGSVTKQVRAVARCSSYSVNTTKLDVWIEHAGANVGVLSGVQISGTNPQDIPAPWVQLGDLTAAQIDALVVGFRRTQTGAWTDCRFHDVWFEAIFAAQPTVTVSQSVLGSTAKVEWVPNKGDADTGDYRWYRAWLTNAAGATVDDSGVVDSPTTTFRSVSGLPSGNYVWHVQTAHETLPGQGHWSAEQTVATTIPVTTRAQVLAVSATPDVENAVIPVNATRDTAQDGWGNVEIESITPDGARLPAAVGNIEAGVAGVAAGWQIESMGTVSATSQSIQAGGPNGNFQRFTATLGANSYRFMSPVSAMPCEPGDYVQMSVLAKVTGAVPVRAAIGWSTLGAYVGPWDTTAGAVWVDSTGTAWTTLRLGAVVPAGVYSWRPGVQLASGAAGGTSTADFDVVDAFVSSIGWLPLRHIPPPASNSVTAYDFEVPPDVPVQYRARAVKADGYTVGDWVYSTPITWVPVPGAVRITPIADPSAAATFEQVGFPDAELADPNDIAPILGSSLPAARYDARQAETGAFSLRCTSDSDEAALRAVCSAGIVFIAAPASHRLPAGYYALGRMRRVNYGSNVKNQTRDWIINYARVRRPA